MNTHTYRNIRKIASADLCSALVEGDWSPLSLPANKMDIDQGLATVTDNLQKAIDKLAPERSANHWKSTPPWISTAMRLLPSKRDATGRIYDRCGSPELLQEFIDLAKEVEERSENARCAYKHNCISDALHGGKKFWKKCASWD